MPRRLALVFALTAGIILGAGRSGVAAPTQTGPAGELAWRTCAEVFQCATLTVPLDPARPTGPAIPLAVIRLPARDPSRRIGSLVMNPGGPGVGGVDFLRAAATSFPTELRERFDLVSFDPRGTGRSAPVHCNADLGAYYALDFSPDTPRERADLVAGVQRFVDSCTRNEGDRLPFMSTAYSVEDLERLRQALGDDRLTFLGFSYGTYLGARYADRYPNRVRALVLDGAIDPALSASEQEVQQAVGFERDLDRFFAWCDRTPSCALHRKRGSARVYDALTARIDARSLPVGGREARALGQTEFELGVSQALYAGRSEWPRLADALADAVKGDGAAIAAYSDAYTGRRSDGRYDDVESAFFATGCADPPPIGGLDELQAIEQRAQAEAPRLGRAIVNNSMACALWPVPAPAAAPVHATGAPPVVVVGTRHDPATPLAWARGLAEQLDSGVLVTARGTRHTAFAAGNPCVDRAVLDYLVALSVPRDGLAC